MDNFKSTIISDNNSITTLEFNSKSVTSILGNTEIQIKTKCYKNSSGDDVIEVFKIKDSIETLIATYIYTYGENI